MKTNTKKLCSALIIGMLFALIVICSDSTVEAAGGTWKKDSKGWYYSYSKGSYAQNKWLKSGKNWYFFNAEGYMVTGWRKIQKKWYYFNSEGAMVTGWKKIRSCWYYFNDKGAMATGWKKVDKKWYFLDPDGEMRTGWLLSGNKIYYLNKNGSMATGKKKIEFFTYTFDNSGVMKDTSTTSLEREQRTYIIINSLIEEINDETMKYADNLQKSTDESAIRTFVAKNGFDLSGARMQDIMKLCKKYSRFSDIGTEVKKLYDMNGALKKKYNTASDFDTQTYLNDVAAYLRKLADIHDEMADIANEYAGG